MMRVNVTPVGSSRPIKTPGVFVCLSAVNFNPHTTPRCSVVTRGILDSYRREHGLLVQEQVQEPRPTPVSPPPSVPTFEFLIDDEEDETFDEDELCPLDCVREIRTLQEFQSIVSSVSPSTLVVCDFYKTACGACRYIQKGFVKLCKATGLGEEDELDVVFLKHNVLDDDDEEQQTDLASFLKIKNVPLFKFYKQGVEVDSFATRERTRIAEAIQKHTGSLEPLA